MRLSPSQDFEIAPGRRVSSWKKLVLDDDVPNTGDWNKAIEIFALRIESRFLLPAKLLIDAKDGGTNGFSILALDFLVIETIAGFRDGRLDHRRHSERLFKLLLTQWAAFVDCVGGENADARAGAVYRQGRCALYHSGATDRVIVRKTGPMIAFHDGGAIEINRTLLHEELVGEFQRYLADLKAPQNKALRGNFRKKMDHLCS